MTSSGTARPAAGSLLDGKVAFISGAGRGIGAAAALLFAREGASVFLTARTESELVEAVGRIRAEGGEADFLAADISTQSGVDAAVSAVVERYGRLDVVFNNAGVSAPHVPIVDTTIEDFDLVTTVNQRAVFLAMAAQIRVMRSAGRGGAIVNNSTVGSFGANPNVGAYAASKRAVNSLTETAAREYGPDGIRVNAIAPGATMTAMIAKWAAEDPSVLERLRQETPLGRPAEPTEIAEAAAWLLSDRSSYVTGVVMRVDGGMRA